MEEVLDLSAKIKPDSDDESIQEESTQANETPSKGIPPCTHPSTPPFSSNETSVTSSLLREDIRTPTTRQRPSPSFPSNFNRGQMYYPNYSMLANRYLAFQQQMFSLMASHMHSTFPWRFPNAVRTSPEDKANDLLAFFPNFSVPQSRNHQFPQDLVRVHGNQKESTKGNKHRGELPSTRCLGSEAKFGEAHLESTEALGPSTTSDQPPRKKSRLTTCETNSSSNDSFTLNHSTCLPSEHEIFRIDSSPTDNQNSSKVAHPDESISSESKSELALQSDDSSESPRSARSEGDSLTNTRKQRSHAPGEGVASTDKSSFPGIANQFDLRRTSEESDTVCDDPSAMEYRERRRKNNAAAKKSRDQRRIQEENINSLAAQLKETNVFLKSQLFQLKAKSAELEKFLGRKREAGGAGGPK